MTDAEARSRTHRWPDPMALAAETRGMSGQEFYAAWLDGVVTPPMASSLGFTLGAFGDGYVEIGCDPDEFHYNPYGTVHGGLAATLLDTATGCSIHTRLPAGTGYATLDLHVNFLRALTRDTGQVTARGEVVSIGGRVAVAGGTLTDGQGRLLARATATCLVMRPESGGSS